LQVDTQRARHSKDQLAPSVKQGDTPAVGRLVVVSNRLPITFKEDGAHRWQIQPSPGGLVTALAPVLSHRRGLWIGWAGAPKHADISKQMAIASKGIGYTLRAVTLTEEEVDQYYHGFSNEILWPLFHDLQSLCNFDPAYWQSYQAVNRKFANVVAGNVTKNDCVWVQDYHLFLAAKELRGMGKKSRLWFFLHTPFPSPDIFMKLPWRSQILEGLLEYDLIGFQTWRDRNNFIHCVEALVPGLNVDTRMRVATIAMSGRNTKVGAFPISVDFREIARQAADEKVERKASQFRQATGGHHVILGVDRLDYSKGIPERLHAFRNALERYPDLCGNASLIQLVSPSRAYIPEYQRLKSEIERLVGEINGRFSQPGWIPVHYMSRNLNHGELLAYYRAADVALITPLKDGMNLIAKEYCAANIDERGVLILSEFAGAASQLRGHSLLVNPYDVEGVADAIQSACSMKTDERRRRMKGLRQAIAKRDIFRWANAFLTAANVDETSFLNPRSTRPVGG
jgi:alpha,alpha-trehalose-phosphate synthase [UDP-forming]